MTTETLTPKTTGQEALLLIDGTLADLRGVNLTEANKITDILLDIRILVDKLIKEGDL